MARTVARATTSNLTRNDLLQGTAQQFIDIASENGGYGAFYDGRLEVMITMKLITQLEIVILSQEEPIAGVALKFDWDRHTAEIESNGEFVDSDMINAYGSTDEIIDKLGAVRIYVSEVCAQEKNNQVRIYWTYNPEREKELGLDRIDQMIDHPDGPKTRDQIKQEFAKVSEARSSKGTQRGTTFGDLSEASINAW